MMVKMNNKLIELIETITKVFKHTIEIKSAPLIVIKGR